MYNYKLLWIEINKNTELEKVLRPKKRHFSSLEQDSSLSRRETLLHIEWLWQITFMADAAKMYWHRCIEAGYGRDTSLTEPAGTFRILSPRNGDCHKMAAMWSWSQYDKWILDQSQSVELEAKQIPITNSVTSGFFCYWGCIVVLLQVKGGLEFSSIFPFSCISKLLFYRWVLVRVCFCTWMTSSGVKCQE